MSRLVSQAQQPGTAFGRDDKPLLRYSASSTARDLHVDPDKERADRERLIHRLGWIAFILMAVASLVSAALIRPLPAQELVPPEITRSL